MDGCNNRCKPEFCGWNAIRNRWRKFGQPGNCRWRISYNSRYIFHDCCKVLRDSRIGSFEFEWGCKFGDNLMAEAIFAEGAAPSTPAASKVTLYAKTDGLLYSKDDVGTETLAS